MYCKKKQHGQVARDASKTGDFKSIVLRWHLKQINQDAPINKLTSLPSSHANLNQYRSCLVPLVLEDARATIQSGLLKDNKISFKLRLKSGVKKPRNPGDPFTMDFIGHIKSKDDESGFNMNVLLLMNKNCKFIALASEYEDKHEVVAKGGLSFKHINNEPELFKAGATWTAFYLGSLVTHERIHAACLSSDSSTVLQQIATSSVGTVTARLTGIVKADDSHGAVLNASQRSAVSTFHRMSGSLMMLQGPPGTGKTTTVTAMLKDLYNRQTRTLVCAPSNKAVQVLAIRFFAENPNAVVVMLGVESKMPASLLPIFLHHIVASTLKIASLVCTLYDELLVAEDYESYLRIWLKMYELIVTKLYEKLLKRYDGLGVITTYGITNLVSQRAIVTQLCQQTPDQCPVAMSSHSRLLKSTISGLKEKNVISLLLLNRSTIVFSTLASCGGSTPLLMNPVTVLIVDEAGQSVEAETLIAFRHKPSKVLLVGDTKQLPATVISQHAVRHHYDWSMMWRLSIECGLPCEMLTEQYRMHPEICCWPSLRYYENRLVTAQSVLDRPPLHVSHNGPGIKASASDPPIVLEGDSECDVSELKPSGVAKRFLLAPYAIYNIASSKGKSNEQSRGTSKCNPLEAEYVASIVKEIRKTDKKSIIGIITFYMAQKELLVKLIKQKDNVQISTVDGFQGDECDIIIISFVRANKGNNVGFVRDERRLNVSITRAKHSLILLGSTTVLSEGSVEIRALISDAHRRGVLHTENDLRTSLGLQPSDGGDHVTATSGATDVVATTAIVPLISKSQRKRDKKAAASVAVSIVAGSDEVLHTAAPLLLSSAHSAAAPMFRVPPVASVKLTAAVPVVTKELGYWPAKRAKAAAKAALQAVSTVSKVKQPQSAAGHKVPQGDGGGGGAKKSGTATGDEKKKTKPHHHNIMKTTKK